MRVLQQCLIASVWLFSFSQTVHAAPVALLPIESADHPETASQLTAYIKEAIEMASSLEENTQSQLTLEEARMSFGCMNEDVDCMLQVAEALKVTILFWGHLTQTKGVWELAIRELSVEAADLTQMRTLHLEDAYAQEDTFRRMARAVINGGDFDPRPTSILSLVSNPPGTRVIIDGEPAGEAPLALEVPHGLHQVVFKLSGHPDQEREVIVGEKAAKVIVEMVPAKPVEEPIATPRPSDQSSRSWTPIIVTSTIAVGSTVGAIFARRAANSIATKRQITNDNKKQLRAAGLFDSTQEALYAEAEHQQKTSYNLNVALMAGAWTATAVSSALAVYFYFSKDKKEPSSSVYATPESVHFVYRF